MSNQEKNHPENAERSNEQNFKELAKNSALQQQNSTNLTEDITIKGISGYDHDGTRVDHSVSTSDEQSDKELDNTNSKSSANDANIASDSDSNTDIKESLPSDEHLSQEKGISTDSDTFFGSSMQQKGHDD